MNNEFKIPKNYFDKVESEILKSTNNEFSVPNNYFENFEEKIIIKATKKRKIPVIVLRNIAIAASIFLLIAIYFKNNTNSTKFKNINQDEIIDYLSENIDIETFDNEIDFNKTDLQDSNIPKNELIEYLENNEIDEELYNNI